MRTGTKAIDARGAMISAMCSFLIAAACLAACRAFWAILTSLG